MTPTVPFQHLGTRVARRGRGRGSCIGQTFWAAQVHDGDAGVAWDWVQITHGVVALADPMSVITNVQLLSPEGAVLTAQEAACYLNELVRALPWQCEVQRALAEPLN